MRLQNNNPYNIKKIQNLGIQIPENNQGIWILNEHIFV